MFLTAREQSEIQRWSRLAIQFNGALDTRQYDHVTTDEIVNHLKQGDVFSFLERELPPHVWEISKLTDVDRHKLASHWQSLANGYEPQQFHVRHNGLALLVAYILHLIAIVNTTPPR